MLRAYNERQPDRLLYANIIHAYEGSPGEVGVTILGCSHFIDFSE